VGAYTVAVAVTEIRNWHRLHELGANEQLKRLTGWLQELAGRATPGDDDKDTKAARRQTGAASKPPGASAWLGLTGGGRAGFSGPH